MTQNAKKIILAVVAIAVIIGAALAIIIPMLSGSDGEETAGSTAAAVSAGYTGKTDFANGEAVVIDSAGIGSDAVFFDYDLGGKTAQLFAVKAGDGSVRVAFNTCQVCNGSPLAYFVQEGDGLVCQNCKNVFSADQVGIVSGGCDPVPISDGDYTVSGGEITVSADFIEQNALLFDVWKDN